MKKIFSILSIVAVSMFALTSCDPETKEEAGGTAVQAMAGNWAVHVDVIEEGETYEDPYGYGTFNLYTYNTASNASDKLFVFENSFWGTKILANCDLNTNKIWAENSLNETDGEETANIKGEIFPNAALSEHNVPIDSICIDIEYDSEPGVIYRYTGKRYTGFAE